jgi:predicted AAA+ superfamily ATPase
VAESTVGAVLSTIAGLDLAHLPERASEPEIDFVLTVGTVRIPLEVKYKTRPDPRRDASGLEQFVGVDVNRAPFGILVTGGDASMAPPPKIVMLPLSTLMLLR